ncbi:MAG: hypothetical protein RSD99_03885, partial [Janthinobacterium sp.]
QALLQESGRGMAGGMLFHRGAQGKQLFAGFGAVLALGQMLRQLRHGRRIELAIGIGGQPVL